MKYNIGDIVEFTMRIPANDYQSFVAVHLRRWKDVKETGIVVGKGNELGDRLCISTKRYGGDYKVMEKRNVKKKCIPIEYKLSLVSSFRPWWFNYHKLLYQSILIEAIGPKY
jgi:hypothetical protein